MADGGSISLDRPFYLPHEIGEKRDPLSRQIVDLRQLEQQDPFLDDFRPKQKSKELLPDILPLQTLPTETEPVDFDRSFFMQPQAKLQSPPQEVAKPVLPLPDPEPMDIPKATISQVENKPLIGAHRSPPIAPPPQSELSKMFQGTVNMLGAVWARVVDDIYETRALGHENTQQILETHVKKRNHINEEFFKKIDEVHENSKKEETWSYLFNLTEFLLISAGIIGGAGLMAAGAYQPGAQMIIGSLLSMGSFALKQMNYNSTYVGALALSGACLTGLGMRQGFAHFGDLAKTLGAINETALNLSHTFMNYVHLGSQKTRNLMERDNNELNIDRLKNRDDIQKTVGSFKMEDLIELSKAASEQIRMKGEVISRILLGSKS